MLIIKFGGSTLVNAKAIRDMIDIVESKKESQPVLVVSAIGKTTRNLLETAGQAAAGHLEDSKKKLKMIQDFHLSLVQDLKTKGSDDVVENLDIYFEAMDKLLEGVSVLRELSPRTQDQFLAYGELISSRIVVSAFIDQKLDVEWTDARQFIITDAVFTEASVLYTETFAGIRSKLNPLLKAGKIPVVQGFIGATENGHTTTLGFEGSDLTASVLGAALEADHIEVRKNVPGIMTADPAVCKNAKALETLSYREVAEMTFFGAKVLHPRAIFPALQKGIPLTICDSKENAVRGTRIVMKPEDGKGSVKSVAYRKPMSLVSLNPLENVDTHSFTQKVMDILRRTNIRPYIFQSAENALSLVVQGDTVLDPFISNLKSISTMKIHKNLGTVSLIGENVYSVTDLPSQILSMAKNVQIYLISTGITSCNFTILVAEDTVHEVVNAFHQYYFEK